LIAQTVSIKQQFMDQAKNVENGLGPDQGGMGMGAPMSMGGYDPYGDGLGRQAAAAPTADAYDF
jgi:DNA-directed RNA polymerase II subunit RPB11